MIRSSFVDFKNKAPNCGGSYCEDSSLELSPRCRDPLSQDSFSSIGSFNPNDSFQTRFEDANQFSASSVDREHFMSPNASCGSSTPWGVRLKSAVQVPVPRRKVGGDWTDPNSNMLLEDFARPPSSPWKNRLDRSKEIKAKVSPPPITVSGTMDNSSRSMTGSESDTRKRLSNIAPHKAARKSTLVMVPHVRDPAKQRARALEAPLHLPNVCQDSSTSKERGDLNSITSKSKKSTKQSGTKECSSKNRKLHKHELAKIKQLKDALKSIREQTDVDLSEIRANVAKERKEIRALAQASKSPSSTKSLDRQLKKNRAIITELKTQNAEIREQNRTLHRDITALRVNNERLLSAQAESAACYTQLKYHDDACISENAKLTKLVKKYQEAIEQHQEHLDTCTAYADTESRMRSLYEKAMDQTVGLLDAASGGEELATDVHAMMEAIE